MGVIVVVAYRPKPGMFAELLEVVRTRVPTLRGLGMATERPSVMMKAEDGTIVEVSEWTSQEAIAEAHQNPVVLEMWGRFDKVCTYEPLVNLAESNMMFANFEPLN